MELKNINKIEEAAAGSRGELFRVGAALIFIVGIMMYVGMRGDGQVNFMLIAAAMIGGYMAMNIGANDVANNVGPAVGSRALTLGGAIVIAAIFEASGALIAGGDVVGTIRNGIIDPALVSDPDTFVWMMMGALLAGAIWLNAATAIGAPVSTTHSIVGGVLGAGIAAGGWDVADWGQVGAIAASWVISPLMGGIIAAGFLYLIKRSITHQDDMVAAAAKMVPLLVAVMGWAFSTYLILKGLKKLWRFDFWEACLIGLAAAVVIYFLLRPVVARLARSSNNDTGSINRLFTVPLIFAAALLSFAHGANDVANAVGPLAAIHDVLTSGTGQISSKAAIPVWVMMVGAIGIALGLALYGPKLIRTVGSEITDMDQMRAYCIAIAAAITVIVASQLGLPVSSTHIAVGGVFGVGFLREYLKASYGRMVHEIKAHHPPEEQGAIDEFLADFNNASVDEMGRMLKELKKNAKKHSRDVVLLTKSERKSLRKLYKQELVKRSHLYRIAAAWIITVPASALLAAIFFYMIRGMML